MKRKIAILLSAMMVASAMPMSASASQLKADGVSNTTFGKANEPIDKAANKTDSQAGYIGMTTEDQLRSRKSVLKINLDNDGTNSMAAGTSFFVDLENGMFKEEVDAGVKANGDSFGYVNIKGKDAEAIKYDGVKSMTNLTQVYEALTVPSTQSEKLNTPLVDQGDAVTKLLAKVKQANTPKTTEEINEFAKAEIQAVYSEIVAESKVAQFPQLAHIPYDVEYVSPTRLKVTVIPALENNDKSITLGEDGKYKKITADNLKIEYFTDAAAANGFVANGSNNASGINSIKISIADEAKAKDTKKIENPFIALPLGGVIADGNGPIKAKVVADYSSKVVGGEYTITKGLEGGSTALVYDNKNVKSFEDVGKLETVVIRENVRNTIGKSSDKDTADITLRLAGGFKFTNNGIKSTDIVIDSPHLSTDSLTIENLRLVNDNTIQFTVKGLNKLGNNRADLIGIGIKNLQVRATNDKNYGDVELTVSGDGISTATKVVAKREALGFKLEAKDPKEIISGRHYMKDTQNMVEADNTTVEVKFSEAVPNTLVTSRALDFNVPEGVKIVSMELVDNETKNITNLNTGVSGDFEIVNNGKTLRLNRNGASGSDYTRVNPKNLASFKMKLNLSVEPGFSGDIKLAVTGGGQSETTETVVAKAVLPFEITTKTTKVDLGYQDYNTADITITETRPGMFLANKEVKIGLKAPYGTGEIGFSQAKFELSKDSELNVKEKDFKNNNGMISFKVDRASYKKASSITIKDVKIGSTRSVPFGSYSLTVGGDAVINNFAEESKDVKYDKDVKVDSTDKVAVAGLINQNNSDYYEIKDYVNVITETGTLNHTVKVTVGEKTVLLGDKAIDMDVAPYIQATSQSTMVPLRFVSVALGVDNASVANPDESNKISFDANTKTTTIYYGAGTGQKIIQFQAGSNIMVVDGTKIPMQFGVKAEIKDGRMFVPFRALGQALGVPVLWDANTRTAVYNGTDARNTNMTETTTQTTTAMKDSTTETTTAMKDSSTETTTAMKDSTTETTTAKK